MRKPFLTIARAGNAELLEKKSRFIGYSSPVTSEAEALAFLNQIKALHREATHHCYAYQIGKENELQRSNDDGEPSGTAGRPILEVLKNAQIQNTALVVVRYFGGILLGTGGLVRAYSKTAQKALAAAQIIQKTPALLYSISMTYPLWNKAEAYLAKEGLAPQEVIFLERVTALIPIQESQVAEFTKGLKNLSNNSIQLLVLEQDAWLERPLPDGIF